MPSRKGLIPPFSSPKSLAWCLWCTTVVVVVLSLCLLNIATGDTLPEIAGALVVGAVLGATALQLLQVLWALSRTPESRRHKRSALECAREHPSYERYQVFVTLLSCGTYVYLVDRSHVSAVTVPKIILFYDSTLEVFKAWVFLELFVQVAICVDYLLQLWSAPRRRSFACSFYGLVDFASAATFGVAVLLSDQDWVYQPLFFVGPLRMLRLRRAFRSLDAVLEESSRNLLQSARGAGTVLLVARLTLFLLLSASIMVVLELPCEVTSTRETACDPEFQKFHLSLYFVVVTLTTVGLGDVTPSTIPGRVFVILLILFGIVWVPWELNRFMSLWSETESSSSSSAAAAAGASAGASADDEGDGVAMVERTTATAAPAAAPAPRDWTDLHGDLDALWDSFHADEQQRLRAALTARVARRAGAPEVEALEGVFGAGLVEAMSG